MRYSEMKQYSTGAIENNNGRADLLKRFENLMRFSFEMPSHKTVRFNVPEHADAWDLLKGNALGLKGSVGQVVEPSNKRDVSSDVSGIFKVL